MRNKNILGSAQDEAVTDTETKFNDFSDNAVRILSIQKRENKYLFKVSYPVA